MVLLNITWEDGTKLHWCLVGVQSDLELGGFGRSRRNTHQCQGEMKGGLKNLGNSWEPREKDLKTRVNHLEQL